MKNLSKIIFLLVTIFLVSCKDEEEVYYNGDSLLQFNKGTSADAFVVAGTTSSDYEINYGVLKAVEGNHQVKLVFDQANSTAVLGTDFEITTATDELSSGEAMGKFKIKLLTAPATQAGKKAVFKLESSSLSPATFNNQFTLNMSLTCPVSFFVGSFKNTETWWGTPNAVYDIVQSTTANQILVKDFWDVGIDMVLNYNPDTYVVSIPDQNTGYFVAQYNGYIWAKPSTDATKISTFNPCTRQMTLYVNYYIPGVGSYGNQTEKFVGQ